VSGKVGDVVGRHGSRQQVRLAERDERSARRPDSGPVGEGRSPMIRFSELECWFLPFARMLASRREGAMSVQHGGQFA